MKGALHAFKQVPIGKNDGSMNISIRVFTVESGGHTPRHSHESEHLNYIIAGEGQVMDGETPRPVSKGHFVFVAPNESHQYRNTGQEPLVFLCIVPTQYE
jgi:quercetin dioxygenase-like cupin family protein